MMLALALYVTVLAPFLGGALIVLLPDKHAGRAAGALIALLVVSALVLATRAVTQGVWRHEISGWRAPLGISLYVDGLAVVMVLMTAAIAGAVGAYASGYFKLARLQDKPIASSSAGYWPVFFYLWGALNILFLVADFFTLYVCLELVTLAAVASIALERSTKALKAAMRYLMAALTGSLAYLLGVALIYGEVGALDWPLVAQHIGDAPAAWVALSLMTVGLVIKSALFPLHFWLPGAHGIAPPPVSALLSALVVKGSFYILIRMWAQVFPEVADLDAAHLLGALGAGAVLWGSFQAIIQSRIKLMIAYSTVAQVGYLFLAFPLLAAASASDDPAGKMDVWNGVTYFVLSHAIAKAALFLVAGIFQAVEGSDEIKDLGGAAAHAPIATLTWGLAGISLIGLPPSGGFLAKWLLLTSTIRYGLWPYAAVILIGGLLASMYIFRVLWHAFLAEEDKSRALVRLPRAMPMAALFLGVLIVLIGLRTGGLFSALAVGSPFAVEVAP